MCTGHFSTTGNAEVVIGCANHCGNTNHPTGFSSYSKLSGDYRITNHGGTPVTFFKGTVGAGTHTVCCSGCWASGIFFSD